LGRTILPWRLRRGGNSFGAANGLQVQLPLMKRFSTALACHVSVQLTLGFGEGVFGLLSRAASSIIRVLHFLHELFDFGISDGCESVLASFLDEAL
jgi:hypothetical protein